MTRVLFAGSSHLGAIKLGWDQRQALHPGIEADFFGAEAHVFAQMKLLPGARFGFGPKSAVPEADQARVEAKFGRRQVRLSEYDAVFIIGRRLEEIANAQLLLDFAVEGLSEAEDRPPMTRATWEALVDDHLGRLLPEPGWAGLKGPRIWFVAKPRMAETALQGSAQRTRVWADLVARGKTTPEGLDLFLARAEAVFASGGLALITPPPAVLGPTGLTRAEYARAVDPEGQRFSGNDNDHSHMNAAYGAVMVAHLLQRIGQGRETAPVDLVAEITLKTQGSETSIGGVTQSP